MEELREQLVRMLESKGAHAPFDKAVEDLPPALYNEGAPNVEYTFWQLLEHMRRAQEDMLDYITKKDYEGRSWPADYWPEGEADQATWDQTIAAFKRDREKLIEIAKQADLEERVPSSEKHTVLRCLFIVAQHNAYHLGAFILMRKLNKAWD